LYARGWDKQIDLDRSQISLHETGDPCEIVEVRESPPFFPPVDNYYRQENLMACSLTMIDVRFS